MADIQDADSQRAASCSSSRAGFCAPLTCAVAPSCANTCRKRTSKLAWRKWCIFVLLLVIIAIVVFNLALTIWLMMVMEFTFTGMGPLSITSEGIRLTGKTMVLDSLVASSIRSREGQPIVLQSSTNVTISTGAGRGGANNRIFVDSSKFECQSNDFQILDLEGNILFAADPSKVTIGAPTLGITTEAGVVFSGSVSTPLISPESSQDLRLESQTRSLYLNAAKNITILSKASGIEATSYDDFKFKSTKGAIKLDTRNVIMPNLQRAEFSTESHNRGRKPKVYQLCICENGRLFLASASGICDTYDDEYICN